MTQHLGETVKLLAINYYKNNDLTQQEVANLDKFIKNKMKKNLIIMDNAGAHRNKIIKNYINISGNQLHYSIPYKPKTNAIET